jgi:prepilin-type N-terminal cleavage/methylation domain-containing protein
MQRTPTSRGFTLIEMITVIAIIAILSGLVLSISGLVQNKGARAKAEAEIKALSSGLESYKTDFGGYPQDTATDALDPRISSSPTSYFKASLALYKALSGDLNANGKIDATGNDPEKANNYVPDFFRPSRFDSAAREQLNKGASTVTISYIVDPFGYSYGYSTIGLKAEQEYRVQLLTDPNASRPASLGYNPTFDLWSTGGGTTGSEKDRAKWVKNW